MKSQATIPDKGFRQYWKLKELTLGYNFILSIAKYHNIKVYLSGSMVFRKKGEN